MRWSFAKWMMDGGKEAVANAAKADLNGDGLANAQEYFLGTAPTVFTVGREIVDGNYRFEGWKSLVANSGDDGWVDITDDFEPGTSEYKFYRAKAVSLQER
jgi:hypothetical protein